MSADSNGRREDAGRAKPPAHFDERERFLWTLGYQAGAYGTAESTAEGAEIIKDLISNIESKGMYSIESALGFLAQAYYCLRPERKAERIGTVEIVDGRVRSFAFEQTDLPSGSYSLFPLSSPVHDKRCPAALNLSDRCNCGETHD